MGGWVHSPFGVFPPTKTLTFLNYVNDLRELGRSNYRHPGDERVLGRVWPDPGYVSKSRRNSAKFGESREFLDPLFCLSIFRGGTLLNWEMNKRIGVEKDPVR